MTFTKILRWTAIASLFAALFTPFIVAQSLFFPFIAGKAIFFRVCVEVAFAAWLLLVLRDASARPKLSPILWSLIAFAAIVGVADMFGVSPWKSFWSNFERMEGYVTILHLLAYFLVAGSVLATEKLWQSFLRFSVAASALVSGYAMMQLLGDAAVSQGGTRLDSFLGNATYLAVYLIFSIFFALILAVREDRTFMRWLYGILIAIHAVVLYYTGTRGAMLGLLAGLGLSALLIALFDKANKKGRIIASSVIGAIVLLVVGFFAVKNSDFVKSSPVLSRFAAISLTDAQAGARGFIWPMAIKGFEERPLLGWGQENFNYVFNANYDPRMYGQEQWFDRAHNVVLDWLVASGILGVLAYLSLWAGAAYLLWRKASETPFMEKTLITGLGAAYFVNNLFVFDNIASYMLFAAMLAFIHFKSTRLARPVGSATEEADDSDMNIAIALIAICLCACVYVVNVRAYATGASLINAMRASLSTPVDGAAAIDAFAKAVSYDTVGRGEVVERLIEATPHMNSADVSLELRQKYYALANAAIQKQLSRTPDDARYKLFSASFYMLYGMNDLALKYFLDADRLSPNKQSTLYALGNFYMLGKKYDDALAVFKKAYELDESNSTALQNYAVALMLAGKEGDASALLKEKTGNASLTGDAFIQAFADKGEWNKVVDALNERIQADPKNVNYRKNLAAAYVELGNKAAAIKVVRDLIALDPTLKEAGEAYIKEIQASGR